jgi:hypothetical protein
MSKLDSQDFYLNALWLFLRKTKNSETKMTGTHLSHISCLRDKWKSLPRSETALISVLVPYNFALPPCGLFHHYYWTDYNLIKGAPHINTYRIKVYVLNEDVFCIMWKSCQSVHSWANIIGILNECFVRPGIFRPNVHTTLRAAWHCTQYVLCVHL